MIHDPTRNELSLATFVGPLGNQRGIALIVAISLLAIMSILGAMLLNTSTSEIQLSGNYRNYQEAFYAADRAVEYSTEVVATGSGSVDLNKDFTADGVTHFSEQVATARSGLAIDKPGDPPQNTVEFLYSGTTPVGSGSDATVLEARNYAVHAVGVAPFNASNPSRQGIRAQVVRIVPK
ncbi:hypothetical protein JCM30471_01450 [Desulfuromonas carbonis]|uniref:pilus assembly PilX family protein n=1 Tax=Desulfuromonas sp. DDH964 TaxID=1823759 RepID=UPI00078CECAF|nr:PilX N-terminal domain-containing pilus assembly protein [Desulfuromonas sp. DDH964]AMV71796.1 hypothetical protein DBW_1434 [Desulfuromonas sp. DDH964]